MKTVIGIPIVVLIVLMSCSRSEPCPEGGELDNLTFSDITLANIAYSGKDSVAFSDPEGNETWGYVTSSELEEGEGTTNVPCRFEGQKDAIFTYKFQRKIINVDFPDIFMGFRIEHVTRYADVYTNDHYDLLMISGYSSSSDVWLHIATDTYNCSSEFISRRLSGYYSIIEDYTIGDSTYTNVYQVLKENSKPPNQLLFNHKDGIILFQQLDGTIWTLK